MTDMEAVPLAWLEPGDQISELGQDDWATVTKATHAAYVTVTLRYPDGRQVTQNGWPEQMVSRLGEGEGS